jgi:hypothetical protein
MIFTLTGTAGAPCCWGGPLLLMCCCGGGHHYPPHAGAGGGLQILHNLGLRRTRELRQGTKATGGGCTIGRWSRTLLKQTTSRAPIATKTLLVRDWVIQSPPAAGWELKASTEQEQPPVAGLPWGAGAGAQTSRHFPRVVVLRQRLQEPGRKQSSRLLEQGHQSLPGNGGTKQAATSCGELRQIPAEASTGWGR